MCCVGEGLSATGSRESRRAVATATVASRLHLELGRNLIVQNRLPTSGKNSYLQLAYQLAKIAVEMATTVKGVDLRIDQESGHTFSNSSPHTSNISAWQGSHMLLDQSLSQMRLFAPRVWLVWYPVTHLSLPYSLSLFNSKVNLKNIPLPPDAHTLGSPKILFKPRHTRKD